MRVVGGHADFAVGSAAAFTAVTPRDSSALRGGAQSGTRLARLCAHLHSTTHTSCMYTHTLATVEIMHTAAFQAILAKVLVKINSEHHRSSNEYSGCAERESARACALYFSISPNLQSLFRRNITIISQLSR